MDKISHIWFNRFYFNEISIDKFLKKHYPDFKIIFCVMVPNHLFLTKVFKYSFLIYDSFDDNELDYDGLVLKKVKKYNGLLIQKFDLVLCLLKCKYKKYKKINNNLIYVSSANSFNLYKTGDDIKKSKGLENIDKTNVGYFENIRNWMDFSLMNYIIEKYQDCFFVYIGSIARNAVKEEMKLRKYKNYLRMGYLSSDKVPSYINFFNVGIIPFKVNDFIASIFSNKFFEYMACELLVVKTRLPVLAKYSHYIGYEGFYEEFGELYCSALNGEFHKYLEHNSKIALENDWENRAKVINNSLLKIVKNIK